MELPLHQLFFLLLSFLATLPWQAATAESPNNIMEAARMTAVHYCDFLNSHAATDPHHLYEEKMSFQQEGIVRSGLPGSYSYLTRKSHSSSLTLPQQPLRLPCHKNDEASLNEENKLLYFISRENEVRYCNWLEQDTDDLGGSSFYIEEVTFSPCLQKRVPEQDPLLKSSVISFFIMGSAPLLAGLDEISDFNVQEQSGEEVIGCFAEEIESLLFLGGAFSIGRKIQTLPEERESPGHTTKEHVDDSKSSAISEITNDSCLTERMTLTQYRQKIKEMKKNALEQYPAIYQSVAAIRATWKELKFQVEQRAQQAAEAYNSYSYYVQSLTHQASMAQSHYDAISQKLTSSIRANKAPTLLAKLEIQKTNHYRHWLNCHQECCAASFQLQMLAIQRDTCLAPLTDPNRPMLLARAHSDLQHAKNLLNNIQRSLDTYNHTLAVLDKAEKFKKTLEVMSQHFSQKAASISPSLRKVFFMEFARALFYLDIDQQEDALRASILEIFDQKIEQLNEPHQSAQATQDVAISIPLTYPSQDTRDEETPMDHHEVLEPIEHPSNFPPLAVEEDEACRLTPEELSKEEEETQEHSFSLDTPLTTNISEQEEPLKEAMSSPLSPTQEINKSKKRTKPSKKNQARKAALAAQQEQERLAAANNRREIEFLEKEIQKQEPQQPLPAEQDPSQNHSYFNTFIQFAQNTWNTYLEAHAQLRALEEKIAVIAPKVKARYEALTKFIAYEEEIEQSQDSEEAKQASLAQAREALDQQVPWTNEDQQTLEALKIEQEAVFEKWRQLPLIGPLFNIGMMLSRYFSSSTT